MNPIDDQLGRLFRSAAKVQPAVESPAFGLETRAMAAWREGRSSGEGVWDIGVLVRGLIVAGVIMAVSFWPVMSSSSSPFSEFLQLSDSSVPSDLAQ